MQFIQLYIFRFSVDQLSVAKTGPAGMPPTPPDTPLDECFFTLPSPEMCPCPVQGCVEPPGLPQEERGCIAATIPPEEEQMELGGGESFEGRNRHRYTPESAFMPDMPGDY